uniref:Uncharacterized protein LOC8281386 isoform X2 n=1 Tax=Rhizophora mucronata TaxID=61149 RepID=A0A2P2JHI7_RHIMU
MIDSLFIHLNILYPKSFGK